MEAILAHMPALAVTIPLAAAPFALILPKGRTAGIWACLISLFSFAGCLALLQETLAEGQIAYAQGGWAAPLGIEFRIDAAGALVATLISGAAALVFPFAAGSFLKDYPAERQPWAWAAMLLVLAGQLGVCLTGDAFNMFVFFEIGSLSTYVLVAMGGNRDRRAFTASFNYLVMGTIGATFFVIGVGLLYQATGTLNMADLAERIALGNKVVQAGFAFIFVGVGLKLAMFPLHLWLPNAYAYAPHGVSAFLAATSTKMAIYVMARFLITVFQIDLADAAAVITPVLSGLAVIGMTGASLVAVFEKDVKRALAYSSIAQVGYILLGLALFTQAGVQAAFLHIVNHGVMKAALFLAIGAAAFGIGGCPRERLEGLASRAPLLAGAITLAGLSLIGVPLTNGFVSKWYLVQSAIAAGQGWAVAAILISSLIAIAYVWPIVMAMYFRPAPADARALPGPFAAPALLAAALCVVLGLYAGPLVEAADAAAIALFQGWRL